MRDCLITLQRPNEDLAFASLSPQAMSPERWQLIEKLYYDSQDRPPAERRVWLAEACAGDAALQREVEALLSADEQSDGFLQPSAFRLQAQQLLEPSLHLPSDGAFSHYRILTKLGAGGMGEVYLAEDASLGRKVALKVLPLSFTSDAGRLQRFIREAKTASALNHPNIITIYEIGQSGDLHFIATEYIEGITLRQGVSQGRLALPLALDIARQIAAALDTAHRANIIHRDIKPENIMLRPDGLVKVLDFGLAKLTESEVAPEPHGNSTTQGMLLGTPRYMSPEQARRQKVDARSDIFSFGAVLYEMVTGQPPFAGPTIADIFAALLHQEPPSISQHVPAAPNALERLITKALTKDCAARYQSMRELQADLQALSAPLNTPPAGAFPVEAQTLMLTATHSQPGASDATPKNLSSLSERLAATLTEPAVKVSPLMILVVLVVLAVALWYLSPRLRPTPPPPLPEVKFETLFGKRGLGLASLKKSRFSPDGKRVAFAAGGEGNNIWVKQVKGEGEHQITFGPWREDSPIWSPDGEQLAFVSTRSDQLGIWLIPSLGGTPKLCKLLGEREVITSTAWPSLVAWAQNGALLYYEWNFQLYRLDLTTKEAVPVLQSDQSFRRPRNFALSLDQKEVAFTAEQNGQYDIWRTPLSGGTAVRVTNDAALDQAPLWQRDGKLLYTSTREGRLQIYLVDPSGDTPTLIPTGDHQCHLADYAAQTGQVLCHEQRDESDIFAVPSNGGKEEHITNDLGAEFWAMASPDGSSLLYQAIPGERFAWQPSKSLLVSKPLLAKGPVVRLAADASEAQWGPNSEQIAFLRQADLVTTQLWIIKAAGGEERRLTNDNVITSGVRNSPPYNRLQPHSWCWSPDGLRLTYCAIKEKVINVWTVATNGTQALSVSANRDPDLGFDRPLWSPDGQRLAYLTETGRQTPASKRTRSLWVTQQEVPQVIFQTEAPLRFLGWATNNELIVALADNSNSSVAQPATIQILSLNLTKPSTAASQHTMSKMNDTYLSNLHLAPNGRSVAFVKKENGRDDIWLLTLSNQAVRRLTNNSDPSLVLASLSWAADGKTIYYDKQARWSLLTMIDRFD